MMKMKTKPRPLVAFTILIACICCAATAFNPSVLTSRAKYGHHGVMRRSAQPDADNEGPGTESTSLDDFRTLMGSLYGVAGIAHFGDLIAGDSMLLTTAGAPVFQDLSFPGQAYALLWCLSGPAAFVASRTSGLADIGLVSYGVIEVVGAALLKQSGFDSDLALVNAVGVQILVAASWQYSSRKTT